MILFLCVLIACTAYIAAQPTRPTQNLASLTQIDIDNRFDILCEPCPTDHGECLLGRCICSPGWSGESCTIPWVDSVPACSPVKCESAGLADDGVSQLLYCNDNPSDTCHLHPQYGVLKVPKERWLLAQQAELSLWNAMADTDNDRSEYHTDRFQRFEAIQNINLGHVLEMASGPFTQLAHIMQISNATVESITLVDPLLRQYMSEVEQCSYKDGYLLGHPVTLIMAGGEELRMGSRYDTVIMINGIEHCQDAIRVLRNVYDALKPGGLFVFHERYFDFYSGRPYELHESLLDFIFHPIRINRNFFEWFLSHFEQVYYVESRFSGGRSADDKNNELYFIGRKKLQDDGWIALLDQLAK